MPWASRSLGVYRGNRRTLREALRVRGIAIDGNRQDRDPLTTEASTDFALFMT
ncbi:hypothetical protein [Nostoc sp. PA-18-2419]|uniref:hypothetical protein n=1 Tax=Nostoc sp. PA-18-2419 TaxID=2575443 RepID=UPI0016719E9D|nr:hypothetical protein [Nostoc sp. PA-18-2419]